LAKLFAHNGNFKNNIIKFVCYICIVLLIS